MSPAANTPKPDLAERGDTGQGYAIGAGTTGKAIGRRLRVLEENYELWERRGVRVYDRMRFSDPKVAGLLRAVRLPIQGAQVHIESPIKEEKDPEFKRGQEIADFVSDNLLHGLADSWRATLYQFLLYLCHGFAPFEIVWKIEDGKALIDRFAYRPPATIPSENISVVNGRVARIQQVLINTSAPIEPIPAEKLLWFCHEREGDNWRGTPLLRPMFKPWFAKEKLELLLLIAADRMNGVPVATAPEAGWPIDENGKSLGDAVDDALGAFCTAENGFFNFPAGTTFQLVASNATIADLTALKTSFEMDMSNVAMAQVLDLGKGTSGSWALGRTLSDQLTDSLSAIASDIEDTINLADGPIHQLVAYNFAGAEDLVPKLHFGSISKLDLKVFAEGLYKLWQMGMPFADETWEWVRQELNLPALKAEDPSAQQSKTPPQKGAVPAPDGTPAPADPTQPQPGAAPVAASEHVHLADGSYWRPLTQFETFVDLADISARMDAAPAALRTQTQRLRDAMVGELLRQARIALDSGDASKVAALSQHKPPMVDKLTAAIRTVYREAFDAGKAQVASELARQKAGTPVVKQMVAERQGDAIAAAAPRTRRPQARVNKPGQPWPGGVPQSPVLADPEAYLDELAAVTARQLAQRTSAAMAAAAMRALSSPATDEAITQAVTRASDAAALDLGVTVREAMLDGRAVQADGQKTEILDAVYSAILDGNQCDPCDGMDGEVTTDLDEAAGWCPNPDCEGGDKCRCMQIYELNPEAT